MRALLITGAVLGAGALGFWLGAKYALRQVQSGVVGGVDSLLGDIGLNPNQGYGRSVHNIADAVAGKILS